MPQAQPTLESFYNLAVQRGQISDDEIQRNVLGTLQDLLNQLQIQNKSRSSLGKLFKKSKGAADTPKSLYIWGSVGRGKSMLMDVFFQHVEVAKKRRVHFHAFMQEVHARLHQFRQTNQNNKIGADPVVVLAQQLASETSLLCFDELQANDVADATLLYRLFNSLFESGVTIVSTSNHPPTSLYTGGIQRERFDKFIALLEAQMNVVSLASPRDYRTMQLQAMEQRYMWPLGSEADAFIVNTINRLCTNPYPSRTTLHIHGHDLTFARYDDTIGRFRFRELCEMPLGAADYLAIAQALDIVILTDIPQLSPEKRNEAKRFVTLIDALYEHKVKLIATAAVAPQDIYREGDGSFEFQRTVSRLMEMQSQNWGTL